jgi:hypothetical protein
MPAKSRGEIAMEDFNTGLLSGIISGLITSVVFLILLSFLRPKISISPRIARGHDTHGKHIWRIKVVNLSHSDAINVRAELHTVDEKVRKNNEIDRKTTKLPLTSESLFLLEAFNPGTKSDYSYVFTTYHNVEKYANIRFRIYAEHEMSRFAKVFAARYKINERPFQNGRFMAGPTFKTEDDADEQDTASK